MKIDKVILGGTVIALITAGVVAYYNSQIIDIYHDKLGDIAEIKREVEAVYGDIQIEDEEAPTAAYVEKEVEDYYKSLDEIENTIE